MNKYTVENIQDFLNFKIDSVEKIESVPWDYPIIKVKGIPLKFSEYYYLSDFLYHLKRQSDFGIIHSQSNSILRLEDLKQNIAFDNSFNIISNHNYGDMEIFRDDLKKFHRKAPKTFWGNYLNAETLEIILRGGRKEIFEYSTIKSSDHNQKALIQRPSKDFDQTEFVYIKTDLKPYRSLDIAYIFEKLDDKILYKNTSKNNWIY